MIPMYEPTAYDYAAIYARVSNLTKDTSIESQVLLGKQVLKEQNLLLYDIYTDKESATKFDPIHRDSFKRLLYDARHNKFKTLIVFRRDRLARIAKDSIKIKNTFKKYNVKIIYSNKGEFQPYDSYISDFVENMLIAIDELEPKTISTRAANGIKKKRESGQYYCGKHCPYGYKQISLNKGFEYVIDPTKAELVITIFKKYIKIDNISYTQTDLLKEINLLSNDKKFSPSYLSSMIKNPIFGGLYLDDNKASVLDYVYKDEFDNLQINKTFFKKWNNVHPILEEDIWYEALKHYVSITKRKAKIKQDKRDYLFKDLLTCKECNKKIYLNGSTYKCSKGCTNIPYSILVDTLLDKIIYDISTQNLNSYYKNKFKNLEAKISQLDTQLKINKSKQRKLLARMIKNTILCDENLNILINEEKKLKSKVNKLKEKTLILIKASETFDTITLINNSSNIKNMIKMDANTSQIFLSAIIQEVTVSGKTKCSIKKFNYLK